jgi:UDP-glucose 4-epimerase
MKQQKSILIGCNGYLGRHLAFHLDKNNFTNRSYDLPASTHPEIKNYDRLDVCSKNDFDKLDPQADFIFMFAGLTGTADGFDRYRAFVEVNEMGLLNLLDWMRRTQCKARIVFPSTRLVYKGRKDHALKEDDPKESRTIYAANKLNAENILWMYQNAFGIYYTVFRICVPYGHLFDRRFSYGTLGFFISKAEAGQDISLFGDGLIGRTFSHVSDISEIIIKAIQSQTTKNEIYNIGGESLTLFDVARLVADNYGVDIKFTDWPDMARKLESKDTIFDDSKLQLALSFQYRHRIKEWIIESISP